MILPVTETHLSIHHSEQHYPVFVKTEDLPHAEGPVVISEEKLTAEARTVADDNLPVQFEQPSYEQETELDIETPVQEESIDRDQEQRILHSQEEIPSTAWHQQGNVEAQTRRQVVIHDERIQEEHFQQEQIQGKQIQQQLPDAALPDQEQFASERNFPPDDSSVPWMQESAPDNVQQSDEFYTPEEQVIPQSHSYSQEYQEESYEQDNVPASSDSHEPWVMVDYPTAEEQENYFQPEDSVGQTQEGEMEMPTKEYVTQDEREMEMPTEEYVAQDERELEMPTEEYVAQDAEEEADYQYYDEEQRMDNEEVDEPQPPEVCAVHCIVN